MICVSIEFKLSLTFISHSLFLYFSFPLQMNQPINLSHSGLHVGNEYRSYYFALMGERERGREGEGERVRKWREV